MLYVGALLYSPEAETQWFNIQSTLASEDPLDRNKALYIKFEIKCH